MSAAATVPPTRVNYLIAVVCGMAVFMELLDTSVANVSLVNIAGSLSATREESTWVVTSYLVANAIILPMTAWLSDRFGRKRYYLASMILFVVASVACGTATSLPMLVAFRILQGLAGGALQPISQAILADSFPPEKRGSALAVYGMAVISAPAFGPVIGGYITEHFGWHWIFLINAPVGFLLVLVAGSIIHDTSAQRERQQQAKTRNSIDYLGFALIALCMGTFQVMLDKGQQEDWLESAFIRSCLAIVLVSGVWLVRRELRSEHPIINLRLLGQRNFLLANMMMAAMGISMFGATLLMPLMMQSLMGYSALDAGLVLAPAALLSIATMPFINVIGPRLDMRLMCSLGFVVVASSMLMMTRISLNISESDLVWLRILQMVGTGFIFIPINTIAYAGLPPGQIGNATAIINLTRNIGGGTGISMVVTYLARSMQTEQAYLIDRFSPLDPVYQSSMQALTPVMGGDAPAQAVLAETVARQAGLLAYLDVYALLSVFGAVMVVMVWFIRRPSPGAAPPPGAH